MTSFNKPFESSTVHLPTLPFKLKYQISTKRLEIRSRTSLALDLLLKNFCSLIYWFNSLVMTSQNLPFGKKNSAAISPISRLKLECWISMNYHKIHTETSLALDLLLEIFVNWFMDKSTGYDVTKRSRWIKKSSASNSPTSKLKFKY